MEKLSEDADDLYKLLKDTAVNEQQILEEYPKLIELAARLHVSARPSHLDTEAGALMGLD